MNKKLAAKNARSRFESWMPTKEFRKQLAAIEAEFGSDETITISFLGWCRDAWLALAFAEKTATRQLRLSPQAEQGADFELKLRNGTCCLAKAPKLGRPSRAIASGCMRCGQVIRGNRPDPYEDWLKRRRAIPGELQAAVKSKIAMGYPPNMSLLIYLNLGTYGTWADEIESELVKYTEAAAGKFRSVWVLWSDNLYRCWPNASLGVSGCFRPVPTVQLGTWRTRLGAKQAFAEI